jgi:hypothetical protein
MSKKYEKEFKKLISEEEAINMSPDEEAFNGAFEDGTNPEDFNTEPKGSPGFESNYVEKARDWIDRINEFSNWVNSADGKSLSSQFNELDRDGSIFQGISKSSQALIKISENLASLTKTIEGFVVQAPKKQREMQQQQQKDGQGNSGGSL